MTRVFVSGCFDRLHPGHVEFLRFARSLGDHLSVSVGSDASIRALKNREPVFNQFERLEMVRALRFVDHAFIPDYDGADDCFAAIEALYPEIWVVNRDDGNIGAKQRLAQRLGIKIVFNARPANYHTTTALVTRLESEPCKR